MIELKNAKTIKLGRNRYAVSGFIGAVQMRESGGNWQDIKPHLVRDSDGWHIEGVPYFAEMKDDGSRLFCPDRNEHGRYIRIPAPALFANLGRNVVQNPAKLDEEILPNQITLPTEWGEYRIIFSNTGMHFEVLFRKAPPAAVFGRDSPRILLDAETLGFDIGELLKSSRGVGIPRPRLISESQELAMSVEQERWLDWNFKDGQLELGFDFGDLTFPILLKNTTIDVQVDAGADDGFGWLPSYWNAGARLYIGNYGGSAVRCFYRFHDLDDFGGATIETAYTQLNRYYTGGSGTATTKVQADDQASPDAPENTSELFAITPTSNGIDWDGVDQAGWAQSPSIVDVIQELADSYGSITVVQIIHDDDGGSTIWEKHSYDTNPSYAPKLYIEFSAGGGEEALAGVIAGVATVGGAIKIARTLASISSGSASVSGAIGILRKLAANIACACATIGQIKISRALAAISSGISSVSGTVKRLRGISAISSGVASVIGTLKTGAEKALAGVIAGAATVGGAIKVARALASISSGSASVSGAIVRLRKLTGGIAGASIVTGSIGRLKKLAGVIGGAATVAGAIKVARALASISSGSASVSGAIGRLRKLTGGIAGVSIVTGSIGRLRKLAGGIGGISSITGVISVLRSLAASAAGSTVVTGIVQRLRALGGSTAGAATAAANVKLIRSLSGLSAGIASVIGNLALLILNKIGLTLKERNRSLTLQARSTELTLKSRTRNFTLPERD